MSYDVIPKYGRVQAFRKASKKKYKYEGIKSIFSANIWFPSV
jgi:hypothetical protein